ncbi:Deoxyribonuclease (DNase) II [Trichuris trichiura]|uniref:Deoxyribonuclease (DNase) II n=1 Tax=Trichuris trichiura TaxID=36087 RepID=A0A077YZG3_TRITR|nr:Deoxyribonuclease (DNase) II [Trichuris trichiura]
MRLYFLVVFFASFFPYTQTAVEYSCRSERPEDILDWFILYKLPKRSDDGLYNGNGFVFIDSSKPNTFWTPSKVGIDQKDQMLYTTLNLYFGASEKEKRNSLALFYSDFPPYFRTKIPKQNGKGIILAYGGKSALWIVHSIPRFPNYQYSWPNLANPDAQMAVCLSIPIDDVGKVTRQLVYQDPVIFFQNVPEVWRTKDVKVLLRDKKKTNEPFFKELDSVSTIDGTKLFVVSRLATGKTDFYADELAPKAKSSFVVWAKLTYPCKMMQNTCGRKYKVENLLNQVDIAIPEHTVVWKDYADGQDCSKVTSPLEFEFCPIFQQIASAKGTCPKPDYQWQLLRWHFAESLKVYNENDGASWALSRNREGYWCYTDFNRHVSYWSSLTYI